MSKLKGILAVLVISAILAAALALSACTGAVGPAGPQGERGPTGPTGPAPSEAQLKALIAEQLRGAPATVSSIARGGRLYDNWMKETGAAVPSGNQPLWALQTTNTRTGKDTWRCKECHGWDYKGKGGTYSSGSHYTGFPSVIKAGATLSKAELLDVMRGAADYRHDFSKVLNEEALTDLVNFLSEGLINDALYLDYSAAGKPVIGANVNNGKAKFDSVCALCHGADGKQIVIEGVGIGDIARDEPTVEILHKIRVGQPGTLMPSAIVNGWSAQDAGDVLSYVQTLP